MTANKIDTTKYNAMVANASPNVKISSTVFKNFIGDVKSVVDHNADEVDAAMKKTADSDLNMNGFKLTNLGAPSANNDAARKVDVDAKVSKSGDTLTGNLAFSGNLRRFDFRNGNNATTVDLVDFPEATSVDVLIRMFRNTNTTGNKIFAITKGDDTTSPAFRIQNGIIDVLNGLTIIITAYAGNPNGNVAAPPGSICLNTSGGAGSSIYVKESGTGNMGWVAK